MGYWRLFNQINVEGPTQILWSWLVLGSGVVWLLIKPSVMPPPTLQEQAAVIYMQPPDERPNNSLHGFNNAYLEACKAVDGGSKAGPNAPVC